MRVKMGATKDGRLTAAEAYLVYEAGAFPGSPVNAGCQCILARRMTCPMPVSKATTSSSTNRNPLPIARLVHPPRPLHRGDGGR